MYKNNYYYINNIEKFEDEEDINYLDNTNDLDDEITEYKKKEMIIEEKKHKNFWYSIGLQGPRGFQGEKGNIGPMGKRGLTGPKGLRVLQGPIGSTGVEGKVGPK